MAVYCTIDDVQARLPQFQLTETSKPDKATAQTLCDDCTAQVEGALEAMGYVIPVTGAKSIAQVRSLIATGTIARILAARAAAIGTEAAWQTVDRYQKVFESTLEAWKSIENPLALSDAGMTGDVQPEHGVAPMGSIIPPNATMDQLF